MLADMGDKVPGSGCARPPGRRLPARRGRRSPGDLDSSHDFRFVESLSNSQRDNVLKAFSRSSAPFVKVALANPGARFTHSRGSSMTRSSINTRPAVLFLPLFVAILAGSASG